MIYEFVQLKPVDTISGLAAEEFLADFDASSLKRNDFSKLPKCKNGPAAGVLFGEDSETVFSEVDWYLRRGFDGKLAHGGKNWLFTPSAKRAPLVHHHQK